MRRSIPFLVLLLATAASCGQSEQSSSSNAPPSASDSTGEAANSTAAADTSEVVQPPTVSPPVGPPPPVGRPGRESGPNIGVTAAPDVAFNYRYGFRLEADRIASVQDQHQILCERYTLARCRITGMNYRAVGDDIEAMMSFSVDPAIAREFGLAAVERVSAADGTVTESEIDGSDVGSSIRASGRSLAELQGELARIETRLSTMDRVSAQKSELEYQAAQLRDQIRALRETRAAQQETLATTPILFRYGSGSLAPGLEQSPTIAEAAEEVGEDTLYALYILLRIAIILLPWAIGAGLVWWIVRALRRRLVPKAEAAAGPEAA